jgi:hypothetical protein
MPLFLAFLVLDNGWTPLIHLLLVDLALASVFASAFGLGCRLVVAYSTSKTYLTLLALLIFDYVEVDDKVMF